MHDYENIFVKVLSYDVKTILFAGLFNEYD